ncbi:MAG: T9SS type A sorting domain-containing protein [Bacteroidetes bacterium]|nr:T9SS type A sorting domain-containing protein [Bacteroidota bacterium]
MLRNIADISFVEVYNVLGIQIFKQNINDNHLLIDMSNNTKGLYFVRLMKGQSLVATDKLLLE